MRALPILPLALFAALWLYLEFDSLLHSALFICFVPQPWLLALVITMAAALLFAAGWIAGNYVMKDG